MMPIRRVFVFLLFSSFWFLVGCGGSKEISIITAPANAEVWLDGEYLGVSPLEISLDFLGEHTIELFADGFRQVEYEVSQNSTSHEVSVLLYPERHRLGYFFETFARQISPDWRYLNGEYRAIDVYDDKNSIDFGEIIIGERLDSTEGTTGRIPSDVVFANDRDTVAYLVAELPAPKCGIVPTQLWLTTLNEPNKQILVLDVPDGSIPYCENSHGFSSDAEWLWVAYEEELGSKEYIFQIFAVDDPLASQVVLNGNSLGLFPQWSEDGKWLAFELANGSTEIFHLENDRWLAIETEISGKPVGWSPENDEVWVLNNSFEGNTQLQAYALDSGELIQEYDLGGIEVQTSGLKFSPDGRYFALAYRTEVIQENEGILVDKVLMGNAETEDVLVFEDLDYKLVLYWLEDNERIAVLAENESGSSLMKILTFYVDNQ